MADERFGFWHFLHVNPFIKYTLLLLTIGAVIYCVNKGYSINTNGLNAPANVKTSVSLKDSPFVEKKTDTPKRPTAKIKYPNFTKKPLIMDANKPTIGSISQVKNLNVGTNFGQVGDNYNGIMPRHLDSTMFFNLIKRVEKFWNDHPNSERNLIDVGASPDKDSRQLAAELIYALKYFKYNVTQNSTAVSPIQSNDNENFWVSSALDNKNVMITVMEQPILNSNRYER